MITKEVVVLFSFFFFFYFFFFFLKRSCGALSAGLMGEANRQPPKTPNDKKTSKFLSIEISMFQWKY